jgi:predicted acyl esterase
MDDGVVLDASVAYPTDLGTGERAAGRFPVAVEHTPYRGQVNPYYAQYGYISVRVNDRGSGASGGVGDMFSRRQSQDGVNVVDWAARRLEGSDGRVALVGCSWPGGNALGTAAHVGPRSPVKAVVAACVGLESIQRDVWMTSGIPTQAIAATYVLPGAAMGANPETVASYRAIGDDIMNGGAIGYQSAWWRDRIPMDTARRIVRNGLPTLLWTGWGDNSEISALRSYTAFQNAVAGRSVYAQMHPRQQAHPRYQIIVGGWGHAQGLDEGIMLQWLETWVRGVDTGIQMTRTPMHLFENGSDRWINTARYPTVNRYTDWFIGADGGLATRPGPRGSDSLAWGDPAETGTSLTYTTAPVTKGFSLSGPMSAEVHARSSNTNLQLIATLQDVGPDGTATEITHGAMLGSRREIDRRKSWTDRDGTLVWPWQTLARDSYLEPGKPYRFDVALEARQWSVEPGHRLRLVLTTRAPSANCPGPTSFSLGADPCYLTAPQQATVPGGAYEILRSPAHPTRLSLPAVPGDAFRSVPCSVTPTSDGVCLPREW